MRCGLMLAEGSEAGLELIAASRDDEGAEISFVREFPEEFSSLQARPTGPRQRSRTAWDRRVGKGALQLQPELPEARSMKSFNRWADGEFLSRPAWPTEFGIYAAQSVDLQLRRRQSESN